MLSLGSSFALDNVEAAMIVCSAEEKRILHANPAASRLLGRLMPPSDQLPDSLCAALARAQPGQAIEWRPSEQRDSVVGCTRYPMGDEHHLVLLKELSASHRMSAQRRHKERQEAVGRLVSCIAQELRSSVASILYNGELLKSETMPTTMRRETVDAVCDAGERLQNTIDGLLAYGRSGPAVAVAVSLEEALTRALGFLRRFHRDEQLEVELHIAPEADLVRANGLILEEVFISLLLNAAQARDDRRAKVVVTAERRTVHDHVSITVADDGPGVPPALAEAIFDPFFTTREQATGLGLSNARSAIESLRGSLVLQPSPAGAVFALRLPPAFQDPSQ